MNNDNKQVLPDDFDGSFKFTNFTNKDFTTKWDNVEHTFPANSTSPMIMPEYNQYEIQGIRKKFARDLAIEFYYNSPEYKAIVKNLQKGDTPPSFTDEQLAPYIQRCLTPLPVGRSKVKALEREEVRLRTDAKGRPVSRVIDKDDSLTGGGEIVG